MVRGLKVSIVSPLDAKSSYGLHTIQLARRLPRYGFEVVLRPTRATGELPADMQKLVQHGANDADIELLLSVPKQAPESGRKTLYYSMCESTQISDRSVDMLNMANIVAVPSDWCATVFSANGVTRPIVTVPLGCDEAFCPQPLSKAEQFTFACAGNLANGPKRKGIERIMQLFRRAFPTEDVRLKVKLNGSNGEQSDDPRITFETDFKTNEQLAEWLSTSHCFVNLATGGFELWPLQAMRCGVPVIAHSFGGMAQFINRDNGLIVSHRLVPAEDSWAGFGMWAEAEEEAVIQAMRYAVENPRHLQALGGVAMESVREFTFSKHVERLAQLLRSMLPNKKPHITQAPSRARKDLITVVFPVCHRDMDLAVAHAHWLATMPMRTEHNAVIVTDLPEDSITTRLLKSTLEEYFPQVGVIHIPTPPTEGWPQAANWTFQQTALYMARGQNPWLWMEPDAVALSEDWLEKIQSEYDRKAKPFMGAIVKGMGHMNGVAVYPANFPKAAPCGMICTDVAFDYEIKSAIAGQVHETKLIQHIWSVQGENASENQDGPAPTKVTLEQARRWLNTDAVIVHRIKDNSLIELLKTGFRKARVEVVLCNWRRPGNIPIIRDAIRAGTERVTLTLIDASETKENACTTEGFDRVFRMPNLGSWNRIVIAGGYDSEYTLLIDDDVLPGPTMVATFLKFAQQVSDNFAVLGFKGRDWQDGKVQIVDDPKGEDHKIVGWLARVYFFKTRDIHHGVGERNRIGNRLRLPSVHIDAVVCKGITRATGQPCYVLPSSPGMEWDALPANDAVWQKTAYRGSLVKTLEKLDT